MPKWCTSSVLPIILKVSEPSGDTHEGLTPTSLCHGKIDTVLSSAKSDLLITRTDGRRLLVKMSLGNLGRKKVTATGDGLDDSLSIIAQRLANFTDALH